MINTDWVAYIGHFLFPWGQAASRRVYGNARSLTRAGYNVVVASGSVLPTSITPLECLDGEGSLAHIGLGTCPNQNDKQWQKALKLLFTDSQSTIDWLEAQPRKPSHIILYGGYTPYLLRLLPWCRRHHIPLIADVVEWYQPEHHGGTFGLTNINSSIAMRYLFHKCDGIIAISSYLADYFGKSGCPILRVPPTLDLSSPLATTDARRGEDRPLTLIYAGSPGKKDLLAHVVRGIELADPQGRQIRLLVLGPDSTQVRSLLGGGALPAFVQVLGKIEQTEVAQLYQEADFSVLLREPLRFAQAGFPTKFVESLANGTPVIANITSDLGEYLDDGSEGLVSSDHSPQAFAQAVGRALALSPGERSEMRQKARFQAERSFDFRNYSNLFASFLESSEGRSQSRAS